MAIILCDCVCGLNVDSYFHFHIVYFLPQLIQAFGIKPSPFFPPIPFPTTFVILFSRNLRALRLIQRLYINRYKLPD